MSRDLEIHPGAGPQDGELGAKNALCIGPDLRHVVVEVDFGSECISGGFQSGLYGGGVANPINALARLIAGLHDEDGRITIPGCYDDVANTTDQELADWGKLPFDESAFAAELGLETLTGGEAGRPALERLWSMKAEGRTTVDMRTGLPVSAEVTSETKKRTKVWRALFRPEAGVVNVVLEKTRKGKTKLKEAAFRDAIDIPTALASLRAVAAQPAGVVSARVLNGVSLYEVMVQPLGEATVEVKAGTFETVELAVFIREVETGE